VNLTIPGLSDMLEATKEMPQQFEALIDRLDKVVVLLEEQNDLLKRNGIRR
jgi:hypothetical protein